MRQASKIFTESAVDMVVTKSQFATMAMAMMAMMATMAILIFISYTPG